MRCRRPERVHKSWIGAPGGDVGGKNEYRTRTAQRRPPLWGEVSRPPCGPAMSSARDAERKVPQARRLDRRAAWFTERVQQGWPAYELSHRGERTGPRAGDGDRGGSG